jgi:RNA polymerase sigma-70 factor (ECF subfamily)
MTSDELNINSQILARCRGGEVRAQFILYKQYSRAMYNIAIRFLNNKMDAEDILQESFVTAFEKLSELTSDNAFASWMKRIVINNCITHIRKHRIAFDDIKDYPADDIDENDITGIDPSVIHNAIKLLPDGGRTILILHALEGYKHREIATMLGISESTSKSQYKRALELLSVNLKHKIYVSQN